MQITRQEKTEMETLSLQAYGSKHKWRKILDKGQFIFDKETTEKYKAGNRRCTRKIYLSIEVIKSAMIAIISTKEEMLKRKLEQLKEAANVREEANRLSGTNTDNNGSETSQPSGDQA